MKVTYVGRSRAGITVIVGDGEAFCAFNESVDVPDEIAESLLSQDGQWTATSTTKKASPANVPKED
jgi:hypothetical protein